MTILNVAYPLAPVGPDACGGAEQVLSAIDSALIDANHCSLVIARTGSEVKGELLALPSVEGPYDAETIEYMQRQCRKAIEQALCCRNVDLVHLHGVGFHTYLPPPDVPALATLHLPVSWYPPGIFRHSKRALFLNCVSHTQHSDCPPCPYLLPPIRNGVGVPRSQRSGERSYALAIGRICPEKGFHLALEAATRAGTPLRIAGELFPYEAHTAYFRNEVAPRLGTLHRFIGPVGREGKLDLYSQARCLVVASTVAETSSLVALEALACGTPVVAFRTGALPEIVRHGTTGFLVNDVEEMAAAIARAAEIDPQQCIAWVREHFSVESMTARYLELYRHCTTGA